MRRIDRAREIVATGLLPSLSAQFRTEVLAFGAGLAPVAAETLTASAPRSDLTAALAEVSERYRGRTVAGIIVLSDGGDTNQDGMAVAVPAVAPVFALGLGTATVGRDREVLSVTAAEAVLDRFSCRSRRVGRQPRSRHRTHRAATARERPAAGSPPRHAGSRRHPRSRDLSRHAERRRARRLHDRDSGGGRRPRAGEQHAQRARPAAHPAAPRAAGAGGARLRAQLPAARLEQRYRSRGGFGRTQGQERTGRRHVLRAGRCGTRRARSRLDTRRRGPSCSRTTRWSSPTSKARR